MKRKADTEADEKQPVKKRSKSSLSDADARQRFRKGLFDKRILEDYTNKYTDSAPYKHAVINGLINDKLLRAVRDEIRNNVSFTPKETDIYKIHQSGDLANLDGLGDEALSKLPSLLALRDAMYSEAFRAYVSHITGSGPLSGRKTDMAINVYTPGCYLLCHDDVIGSRKVSYILYLTDPDKPWQEEWGGALRLYPVQETKDGTGEVAKTPLPDASKVIPPAWNQLSFFAVQPGESFHDVEEVHHADTKQRLDQEGGRIRMAISGWFHIPQVGEAGYVAGEEERLAKNSSLMQLRGNPDQYDLPLSRVATVEKRKRARADAFTAVDLEFLLKYIAPTYLTPDTLDQICAHFDENSSITLPSILSKKFSERLRDYVTAQEAQSLPSGTASIESTTPWTVARPPHKHRYLFQQPTGPDELRSSQEESPITELLDVLLPSRQFRQWLQLATGCTVESHDLLARRFRRGLDYTLATGHDGKPRLELNLGFTPTSGWGDEDDEEAELESKPKGNDAKANGKGKAKAQPTAVAKGADSEVEVGGHEVYMAGDEDADEDAAVYKTAGGDDENILFFQAAAWNKMTIVLRDSGALRFVKYVSRRARGDRWDISGTFGVEDAEDDAAEEGEEDTTQESSGLTGPPLGESEDEFNGFSDSHDSDSD